MGTKYFKHCDLCNHPKRDFTKGLICSLTDKKPNFKDACPNFKFISSFKSQLTNLLDKIESLKKQKPTVYLAFVLFSAVGLITVILTLKYRFEITSKFDFTYTNFLYLCVTLLLLIVGIGSFSIAFSQLRNHYNLLKKFVSEKKEINEVLKNYNLNIERILNL